MTGVFRYPGMFFGWGIKSGDLDPVQAVNQCADAGFGWVAQEFGDSANEPSPDQITQMRATCHARGLHWAMWEVAPTSLERMLAVRPNMWILNVEAPGDYDSLLADFRLRFPLLPAAVITNGDLDPRPFITRNIKIIPECYQQDDAGATPERMTALSREMGWRLSFPCLGVYHEYPLANYVRAGDGYSIYLAEEMQVTDWALARQWNGR